jgi:hypothetical protein
VNEESDGSITVSPSLEIIGRGSYDVFAADDAPLKHDKHGFKWDGEVWYLNANGLAKIGIYSFEEVARSIHLKCIPHHQRFTVVRHHEAAVAADRLRQRASATAEDEPEIQVVASRTPDEVEEDKRRATVDVEERSTDAGAGAGSDASAHPREGRARRRRAPTHAAGTFAAVREAVHPGARDTGADVRDEGKVSRVRETSCDPYRSQRHAA